jgi:hypothetical protein
VVAPALVTDERAVDDWVQPVAERQGDFRAVGVARVIAASNDDPADLSFAPFYRTHGRTYGVYHDVLTAPEFTARTAARDAEIAHERRIEHATVAFVQPGSPLDEQKFNYRSDPATRLVTRTNARTARGGAGSFSFDLPVETSGSQSLIVTYRNDLGLPVLADFAIEVDGTPLARYTPNRSATGFWDAIYVLPSSAIAGKNKVAVRFVAGAESRIAPVYGIRVIRTSDAQ